MERPSTAAKRNGVGYSKMLGKLLFKLFNLIAQLYAVISKRRAVTQHCHSCFNLLLIHVVNAGKLQRQWFCANRRASVDSELLCLCCRPARSRFFLIFNDHGSPPDRIPNFSLLMSLWL